MLICISDVEFLLAHGAGRPRSSTASTASRRQTLSFAKNKQHRSHYASTGESPVDPGGTPVSKDEEIRATCYGYGASFPVRYTPKLGAYPCAKARVLLERVRHVVM